MMPMSAPRPSAAAVPRYLLLYAFMITKLARTELLFAPRHQKSCHSKIASRVNPSSAMPCQWRTIHNEHSVCSMKPQVEEESGMYERRSPVCTRRRVQ
ncbi:hypothetical protein F5Y08DRAFT_216324 [Xylaria arbuscula]|nr:hypothetical protein F5Y08DRAFT_216324 [Xylaria arbuscula]